MSELEVRIVELPPLRVASFLGFGREPENQAWEKLLAWAKPRRLLEKPKEHPLYGFNNPNPSAGSPNYGYEAWIVLDPEEALDPELDEGAEEGPELKSFGGGRYAITRCEVPKGEFEVIGETWKRLVAWREGSRYRCGAHQWLEQSLPEDRPDLEFVLDLYLPIAE